MLSRPTSNGARPHMRTLVMIEVVNGELSNAGQTGLSIRHLRRDELDLLEPLWSALREHHQSVAAHLGPSRKRAESWARRRAQYETWLSEPDSFVLVAERNGCPVGYAMVHLRA